METNPKTQFAFYVLDQEKKRKLTPQQQKVKKLSEISQVCLKKDESKNTQSLFKCVERQAKIHILAH
jgi:hypothetical protein